MYNGGVYLRVYNGGVYLRVYGRHTSQGVREAYLSGCTTVGVPKGVPQCVQRWVYLRVYLWEREACCAERYGSLGEREACCAECSLLSLCVSMMRRVLFLPPNPSEG